MAYYALHGYFGACGVAVWAHNKYAHEHSGCWIGKAFGCFELDVCDKCLCWGAPQKRPEQIKCAQRRSLFVYILRSTHHRRRWSIENCAPHAHNINNLGTMWWARKEKQTAFVRRRAGAQQWDYSFLWKHRNCMQKGEWKWREKNGCRRVWARNAKQRRNQIAIKIQVHCRL